MGLDIAELMIAIEEEFDIDISEAKAQQIETVGDMVDMIVSLVPLTLAEVEEARQKRAEGLQKAKETLCRVLNVEESELSEDAKLDDLFPRENRNLLWKKIQDRYPGRIPSLYGKGCLCLPAMLGLVQPTEFSYNCGTVIGLARFIVPHKAAIDGNGNPWTQERIEKAVISMLAECTGIKPEKIDRNTFFYEMF